VALGGIQQFGVNAQGQLGVRSSSARFKEAIKPMGEQSEAILSLQPVSFRYKKELDPSGDAQFGLVAEDVAKVAPELVVTDDKGKPFSVRYEEVHAMLLNEFLKEHETVQERGATIARQQKQIEALTAGLQKVSAQVELSKPAPQTVANDLR
jgi:trimeric autotransporter adhesin